MYLYKVSFAIENLRSRPRILYVYAESQADADEILKRVYHWIRIERFLYCKPLDETAKANIRYGDKFDYQSLDTREGLNNYFFYL